MEKSTIIFLAVPDFLKDEVKSFELNPSILLPVEYIPEESFDLSTLSWEMILSGMLRVISVNGKGDAPPRSSAAFTAGDIVSEPEMSGIPQEWIDYYRGFVFSVKPEIYHEFTCAAIVKTENGDFDMAIEINAILEGLFPRSPGVLLNKALILEKRAESLEKNSRRAEKENAQAFDAYQTALTVEPVLPDTLFNAGFFFMRHRDFARAKDCFSRYVSKAEEADSPDGISSDISAEIPEEKKKQAQKILQDIGGQHLDDDTYQEAYDYISGGNDEKGLLKIREFIEKHPKVWNGWFVLGWALRKLGRYADSLEAFKKAASLGGANTDTRNETAICLMELGRHKEARKELELALQEEPLNIKLISNLGVLAMKAGNKNEAAAFFRTVLELDPSDPLASHFLEEL